MVFSPQLKCLEAKEVVFAMWYRSIFVFLIAISMAASSNAETEVEQQARRAISEIDCKIANLSEAQPLDTDAISEAESKRRIAVRLWKAKGIEISETPNLDGCKTGPFSFEGDWEYRDAPKSGTFSIKGKILEYIPGDTIPEACSGLLGAIQEVSSDEIRGVWTGNCSDLHASGAFIMKREKDGVVLTECMMLTSSGMSNTCDLGSYYREVVRMTSAESEAKIGKVYVTK